MATQAQQEANQANSQHSTGPKTSEGKAKSSANNIRHGLTGRFFVLESENGEDYQRLLERLCNEHAPDSYTELILVESMAQHHWLRQRALFFQHCLLDGGGVFGELTLKATSLYLRYEAAHERAFSRCLADLLKIRTIRRKELIGFESCRHKEVEHKRQTDLHIPRVRLAQARVEAQDLLNESRKLRNQRLEKQHVPSTAPKNAVAEQQQPLKTAA